MVDRYFVYPQARQPTMIINCRAYTQTRPFCLHNGDLTVAITRGYIL